MRLVVIALLLSISTFSQTRGELLANRLDSLRKYHLIFLSTYDVHTTTHYSRNGSGAGSATARSIVIDFRVGTEGALKNIGRKGKTLFEALQKDPEAYAELKRAYQVHQRKKRLCNTLEILGYVVVTASAVPLLIGLDDYNSKGLTNLAILGGAGLALGITDIIVFQKRTEKHMDAFAASVERSIQIFNQNLLNKIK